MRILALLLCVCAATACRGPTEIVASIESDIAPARQLAISLAVARLDGTGLYASCTGLDGVALPLTLGMTPMSATGQRFRVTAEGHTAVDCSDDPPLVAQSATVRFHDGKRELLALGLYDACVGVSCPAGQTCDPATRQCVDDTRETLPPLDGADLAPSPPADLGPADLGPPDLAVPTGPFVIQAAAVGSARRPSLATNGTLYLLAFEELDAVGQTFVHLGTVDTTGRFSATGATAAPSINPEVAIGTRVPTAPAFLSYASPLGTPPYNSHLRPLTPSFGLSAVNLEVGSFQPDCTVAVTTTDQAYLAAFEQPGAVEVYHFTNGQLISTGLFAVMDTVALGCETSCFAFGHSGSQLVSYAYAPVSGMWARPPLVVMDPVPAATLALAGPAPTYVWSAGTMVGWEVGIGPYTATGGSVPPGERPAAAAMPGGGIVMLWNGGGGAALIEQVLDANGTVVSSGFVPLPPAGQAHNPRVAARGPERLVVWDDGQGTIWGAFRN